MKIIPGGVADKSRIKFEINESTISLDKVTDEDIQKALEQPKKRST